MTTRGRLAEEVLEEISGPFNFARYVRGVRITADQTQVQMARKLGISRSTLCDIEKGRQPVSVKFAIKIAKKAGMSPNLAVQMCLQDHLDRAKFKAKVQLLIA